MSELIRVKMVGEEIILQPHGLWVGCGDMFRRAIDAAKIVIATTDMRFSFVDVVKRDAVKQQPPDGCEFFNLSRQEELCRLYRYVMERPVTHIFIANLPPQHLMTAGIVGGMCPLAKIIIAKPLDTNLQLIKALASGKIWPGLTERIFLHDHYRNKGAAEPIYCCLPNL